MSNTNIRRTYLCNTVIVKKKKKHFCEEEEMWKSIMQIEIKSFIFIWPRVLLTSIVFKPSAQTLESKPKALTNCATLLTVKLKTNSLKFFSFGAKKHYTELWKICEHEKLNQFSLLCRILGNAQMAKKSFTLLRFEAFQMLFWPFYLINLKIFSRKKIKELKK